MEEYSLLVWYTICNCFHRWKRFLAGYFIAKTLFLHCIKYVGMLLTRCFFHLRAQSQLPSLHGRIRISKNPYSCMFYVALFLSLYTSKFSASSFLGISFPLWFSLIIMAKCLMVKTWIIVAIYKIRTYNNQKETIEPITKPKGSPA